MTGGGSDSIIISVKKDFTETDKFVFRGLKVYAGILLAPFVLFIVLLALCLF